MGRHIENVLGLRDCCDGFNLHLYYIFEASVCGLYRYYYYFSIHSTFVSLLFFLLSFVLFSLCAVKHFRSTLMCVIKLQLVECIVLTQWWKTSSDLLLKVKVAILQCWIIIQIVFKYCLQVIVLHSKSCTSEVPKVKVLIMQNGPFQNHLYNFTGLYSLYSLCISE